MTEQTKLKLKALRLSGMLSAYEALIQTNAHKEMSIDELLAHLVDAETEERYTKKVSRYIKGANFRYRASLENFDTTLKRGIDRTDLARLSQATWANNGHNIIITGATGVGKSYFVCALGQKACIMEKKTVYFSIIKLFRLLKESFADNSYTRIIKNIAKHQVLILDDFGIEPFTSENRRWLLEILEDRHEIGSTIISTQLPIKIWTNVIGDPTLADAIVDRLIHNAIIINMTGTSYRNKGGKKLL